MLLVNLTFLKFILPTDFAFIQLEQECPQDGTEPCYCTNFRLDIVAGKQPTFSVGVDCSNRRLTSLPPKLPTNTISLNVSSNNVSLRSFFHGVKEFLSNK